MVEECSDDANRLAREMRRRGYVLSWKRVATVDGFRKAVAEQEWDLLTADCRTSSPGIRDVLAILDDRGIDLPLILVSDAPESELAALALHTGAQDYLAKDNLCRLTLTVERILRLAGERSVRRQTESALRESEERFRE